MSTSEITILCGSCESPAKSVTNPEPHDQVSCSGCGRTDSFENVMESVKAHIAELTAQHLSDHLRRSTRGNSFIKMEVKKRPPGSFDWISHGLEL